MRRCRYEEAKRSMKLIDSMRKWRAGSFELDTQTLCGPLYNGDSDRNNYRR